MDAGIREKVWAKNMDFPEYSGGGGCGRLWGRDSDINDVMKFECVTLVIPAQLLEGKRWNNLPGINLHVKGDLQSKVMQNRELGRAYSASAYIGFLREKKKLSKSTVSSKYWKATCFPNILMSIRES